MIGYVFLAMFLLSVTGFMLGRARGKSLAAGPGVDMHSMPNYHGMFIAVWVILPAFIVVLLWVVFQGPVIDRAIVAALPDEMTEQASPAQVSLFLSEIKNVASGTIFGEPSPAIREAASSYVRWHALADWAMVAVALAMMVAALLWSRSQLAVRFRARTQVERIVTGLMIFCSVIAILTTIGIIVSLVYEAIGFFRLVPINEFLFGLRWEPQISIRPDQIAGAGAFGAVPVFVGTLVIATIAMVVAVPIGLFTAIYLVEYANDRVRSVIKPAMEMLAGIPTVVYGFFAVLTVAPAVREAGGLLGIATSPNSALAAGGVLGIMIIPFISSISDDALNAVPRSMRDGSLALGATRAETVTKVLLRSALPGVMGGVLLALSRAIGETMIVVMAAGLIANMNINPMDSVTTVTVQIVTLLIGDTSFDNPKTLAAFALGLVLFIVTLILNVIALQIVRRYREQYE